MNTDSEAMVERVLSADDDQNAQLALDVLEGALNAAVAAQDWNNVPDIREGLEAVAQAAKAEAIAADAVANAAGFVVSRAMARNGSSTNFHDRKARPTDATRKTIRKT